MADWRRRFERSLLGLAIVLVFAALLVMRSGIVVDVSGVRVDIRDPLPLLFLAGIVLCSYLASASGIRVAGFVERLASWLRGPWLVLVLSLLTLAIGARYCAPVAGGADSYGYVSQADRWLDGSLRSHEPWLENVPWPAAAWTFCPLGYVPADGGTAKSTLVPMYSPGLPLLMAGVKFVFGHCAVFAIVPLSGALVVFLTYLIGRRLGSPHAGAIGAWLVATSPAFLYMLAWPMSDVPVTAAFALALYLLIGSGLRSASLAGLAVSAGILIRPNLFFAAPVLGAYFVVEAVRSDRGLSRPRIHQALAFGLGCLPGFLVTALVNRYLHGSPFRSGYASMGAIFALANVLPNVKNYFTWLLETQTPIVLVGLVALLVPKAALWPGLVTRSAPWIMGFFVILLFGMYFAYLVFDAWWFLRFLLPAWPLVMIASGSAVMALMPVVGGVGRWALSLAILAIGLNGYWVAARRNAFELWKEGKKYVAAAELVAKVTPPNSVVMAMQHSGSVRYYAGRLTLRYDSLDPTWLDRAVDWLSKRGIRTYLLVDSVEVPVFQSRFATQRTSERLAGAPLVDYAGSNRILLFELSQARAPDAPVESVTEAFDGFPCVAGASLKNPLLGASR